jgi:hypothetical protein
MLSITNLPNGKRVEATERQKSNKAISMDLERYYY